MRIRFAFLCGVLTLLAFSASAVSAAAAPESLGAFSGWETYRMREKTEATCFMMAAPAKSSYAATKKEIRRDDVLLMVTLRPTENIHPVISFEAGYAFRKGSEVKITIGKSCYSLFTSGDTAWARTPGLDRELAAAIARENEALVEGVSASGRKSRDTFSLKGSALALKAVQKGCGQ
jgi:hypothetical protein